MNQLTNWKILYLERHRLGRYWKKKKLKDWTLKRSTLAYKKRLQEKLGNWKRCGVCTRQPKVIHLINTSLFSPYNQVLLILITLRYIIPFAHILMAILFSFVQNSWVGWCTSWPTTGNGRSSWQRPTIDEGSPSPNVGDWCIHTTWIPGTHYWW